MYMYPIIDPKVIPVTSPTYIPVSAMFNPNANSAANIISRMNDLSIVMSREDVPFPIDWKMFPASTPSGMNRMKKHNILRHSTILPASIALSAEYENMYDNGSAHTKKNVHIIAEDISPSFTP